MITALTHDTVKLAWKQPDQLQSVIFGSHPKLTPFGLIGVKLVGDIVFVKSEERHQTKLDRKYKGSLKLLLF